MCHLSSIRDQLGLSVYGENT